MGKSLVGNASCKWAHLVYHLHLWSHSNCRHAGFQGHLASEYAYYGKLLEQHSPRQSWLVELMPWYVSASVQPANSTPSSDDDMHATQICCPSRLTCLQAQCNLLQGTDAATAGAPANQTNFCKVNSNRIQLEIV